MMTKNEAEKNLKIDTNSLDDECQKQPSLLWEVSYHLAELISIKDKRKEDSDKVWATKFVEIKKLKGDNKVSDAVAKSTVDCSEDYLSTYRRYLDAKYEVDIWTALRDAYQQRATMLRELCGLYLSGYFGDITVKTGSNKIGDKLYERSRERIRLGDDDK